MHTNFRLALSIVKDRKYRGRVGWSRMIQTTPYEAPFYMIAQTIQLALAPVFVLVAIGNIMNLLSTRLGRVVDRSRTMQERHGETNGVEHDMIVLEIRLLDRRIVLIGRAILLLVLSGLTIGLTVVILFLGDFLEWDQPQLSAASFIVAIGLLMGALLLFLLETRQASAALRIPEDYLELGRSI